MTLLPHLRFVPLSRPLPRLRRLAPLRRAPREKNKYLHGIDRVLRALDFKGDILEDLFHARYREYGPTHKQDGVAGEVIHTVDPAILRTVLSTRFKDYGVGGRRKRNLAPVVGHGNFTWDGEEWGRSRGR
ncbi:hypothetical protein FGG08_000437 [Glutinoglossum americanum]|uniref:Uncharacterized protein n=1 Tax=Glutinoglossum americanum TaxID=1670608 RepID=A0A9P8IFA9_9PEZI|nr:hypothetical protein FGG08_000437 [Glutinoglossum americanum]